MLRLGQKVKFNKFLSKYNRNLPYLDTMLSPSQLKAYEDGYEIMAENYLTKEFKKYIEGTVISRKKIMTFVSMDSEGDGSLYPIATQGKWEEVYSVAVSLSKSYKVKEEWIKEA